MMTKSPLLMGGLLLLGALQITPMMSTSMAWLGEPQYRLHITVWIVCTFLLHQAFEQKKLKKRKAEEEKQAAAKKEKQPGKAKEEGSAAKPKSSEAAKAEDAPVAAEATPWPEFKLSQMLPMFVMFSMQKFDIKEAGYTAHLQVFYVLSQLGCCCVLGVLFVRIRDLRPDDAAKKVKVPAVKVMGKVHTPASELSAKEYDMSKWKELAKRSILGLVVTGAVYAYWATLLPLAMQALIAPLLMWESPLFKIHIRRAELSRPFPEETMFGMPSPAKAAETTVEKVSKSEKKEKKKNK